MGRKKIGSSHKAREAVKAKRYSGKTLPRLPNCKHKGRKFKCGLVTSKTAFKFFQSFYKNKTKISQDTILLKCCHVTLPKRKDRPNKGKAPRNVSIEYSLPLLANGSSIRVCQKMFQGILHVSNFRVQRLCKKYLETREAPKENRIGDRKSHRYNDKRDSVKNFIKSFKVHEVHYCRGRSQRQYLSGDLSINKMYRMYQVSSELKVTRTFFRNTVNQFFNIGFKPPATDVCSTCLSYKEKIKTSRSSPEKTALMIEYNVHKKRANAFFELAKEERPDLITLSFDCQKNMPLPKVPDQAAYYLRQFYVYNFGVVVGSSKAKLTKDNVFLYIWGENDRPKGSNEISSALYHRMHRIDLENKKIVRLICDGCGGQNKNTTLVAACMHWLSTKAPRQIKEVQIIFPVPGHSFIPPDRVFGNIEKDTKKRDTIISKAEYFEIFKEHGSLVHLGSEDCPVFNWKDEAAKILKTPGNWHFRFNQSKRFFLRRKRNNPHTVLVSGESFYRANLCTPKSVLKFKKKLTDMKPSIMKNGVQLKKEKKNDVDKLLTLHFGKEWKSLDKLIFFKEIIVSDDNQGKDNIEQGEENICEIQEDCPDLRI